MLDINEKSPVKFRISFTSEPGESRAHVSGNDSNGFAN